jgi:rubredoxin
MHDQSGSRGDANFVWKCRNCKVGRLAFHDIHRRTDDYRQREHSANIKEAPKAYAQSSPVKRVNILEFDCRGLEFVEFKPDGQWLATGIESGTKFADIDLSEGDWYEYDEKASSEVSIKDLTWEIRRA